MLELIGIVIIIVLINAAAWGNREESDSAKRDLESLEFDAEQLRKSIYDKGAPAKKNELPAINLDE